MTSNKPQAGSGKDRAKTALAKCKNISGLQRDPSEVAQ
jgi:hypothetical protein